MNGFNTIKLLSMTSSSSLSATATSTILPNKTDYTLTTLNSNYSTVTKTMTTMNTTKTMTTTNSTSIKFMNLKQLWNFILYSNKIVYQKICKLLLQLYTNYSSTINLNKRKELCFNIMKLCYTYIKTEYNEVCILHCLFVF